MRKMKKRMEENEENVENALNESEAKNVTTFWKICKFEVKRKHSFWKFFEKEERKFITPLVFCFFFLFWFIFKRQKIFQLPFSFCDSVLKFCLEFRLEFCWKFCLKFAVVWEFDAYFSVPLWYAKCLLEFFLLFFYFIDTWVHRRPNFIFVFIFHFHRVAFTFPIRFSEVLELPEFLLFFFSDVFFFASFSDVACFRNFTMPVKKFLQLLPFAPFWLLLERKKRTKPKEMEWNGAVEFLREPKV